MQKKFIKIESQGMIDPQAFALLGASTKRNDDSKIGFFGSGLKYSIAYLLRNNIEFKVYSEYREITFTTKPTSFRDKDFNLIIVDGKETSMTTDMGIDWEAWFIVREIYCNAIDEGESSIRIVSEQECVPIENKTVFYIEVTDNFKELIANWELYFSEKRADLFAYDSTASYYTGGDNLIIYRKGVRCLLNKETNCIFNYDLDWVQINESRVIKSDFDFRWNLSMQLKSVTDKRIINRILDNIIDTWEYDLFWNSATMKYSNQWLYCIDNRILVPYENAGFWADEISISPSMYLILPSKMVDGLKERFEEVKVIGKNDECASSEMKVVEKLNERQQSLFNDAKEFLKEAGYAIESEIVIVRFAKLDRLGLALNNKIYLSEKLFNMGRKEIVSAIIEEQEHINTGFQDETRAFQNHFIMKYITEIENRIGKYL